MSNGSFAQAAASSSFTEDIDNMFGGEPVREVADETSTRDLARGMLRTTTRTQNGARLIFRGGSSCRA